MGTPHQEQRGAEAIRSRRAINEPPGSAGATRSSTVHWTRSDFERLPGPPALE